MPDVRRLRAEAAAPCVFGGFMAENDIMSALTRPVSEALRGMGRAKLADMYERCFRNTWDTTLTRDENGVFLITGDIPAMWLRDSSAQVWHYLPHAAEYPELRETICGLIRRQFACVLRDPYANAHNASQNGKRFSEDSTNQSPEIMDWLWERKYEIDSLCYPVRLCYEYWQRTGDTGFCDANFIPALTAIVDTFQREQRHAEQSDYYFVRTDCPPSDTLPCNGRGTAVAWTGMTWSGFRPSDDACQYGYLIPSNLFAASELKHLARLAALAGSPDADGDELDRLVSADPLAQRALRISAEIAQGVRKYGVVEHERFGRMYAYETDGLGNYNLMDDANVPSLLSLPYIGAVRADDELYQNTRRFVLSEYNPYYYAGSALRGVGSPHTPPRYVWPIALCIQGLTSRDPAEIAEIADMLENGDAGTGYMHEGVFVDDPARFTRPWFAWANSLFSEFVEAYCKALSADPHSGK